MHAFFTYLKDRKSCIYENNLNNITKEYDEKWGT